MKDGIVGKDGVKRTDHGIVLKEQTWLLYPLMNDRRRDAMCLRVKCNRIHELPGKKCRQDREGNLSSYLDDRWENMFIHVTGRWQCLCVYL